MIKETYSNFESKTKVLWQEKIVEEVENTASDVNVTKKPFVCYISGVDSRGGVNENSRSDVNLLVTINPNNGQMLMTSIPRDYYVKLANCGKKDKLTHSALYGGTENSIKTIEDFLDINIDFYARVDFQSVIQLVDALGGIDIYLIRHLFLIQTMVLRFLREMYIWMDVWPLHSQENVILTSLVTSIELKTSRQYYRLLSRKQFLQRF